jgi:hypothetical protein
MKDRARHTVRWARSACVASVFSSAKNALKSAIRSGLHLYKYVLCDNRASKRILISNENERFSR